MLYIIIIYLLMFRSKKKLNKFEHGDDEEILSLRVFRDSLLSAENLAHRTFVYSHTHTHAHTYTHTHTQP